MTQQQLQASISDSFGFPLDLFIVEAADRIVFLEIEFETLLSRENIKEDGSTNLIGQNLASGVSDFYTATREHAFRLVGRKFLF